MAAIILPHRLRRQPPRDGATLDLGGSLLHGVTDVALPGYGQTLVRGTQITPNNSTFPPGIVQGAAGQAWKIEATSSNVGVQLGTSNKLIPSTTELTCFVYRRCRDTTLREGILWGYSNSISDRVMVHAPYTDGNMYWEGGNTSTGRLSVAFAKTTNPETLVFVAGAGKGRQIWRDGRLIASNSNNSVLGNASSSTHTLGIGGTGPGLVGQDNDDVYLIGWVARAWTDAECREWSQNPWSIFRQPRRIWVPVPALGDLDTTVSTAQAQTIVGAGGVAIDAVGGTSQAQTTAAEWAEEDTAVSTAQAQTAAAQAAVGVDASVATSQAQSAAASVGVAVDASVATSQAQTIVAQSFDGPVFSSATSQAQTVAAAATLGWDVQGSTSQAQTTAAAAGVAASADGATAQAQQAGGTASVSVAAAVALSQAQTASGAFSAGSEGAGTTSQAQRVVAAVVVAADLSGSTSSVGGSAAGVLGVASVGAGATSQAQTVAAASGVGVVIQEVATRQAQAVAGQARVENLNEVETAQVQSASGALSVGVDVVASTSQRQGAVGAAGVSADAATSTSQAQTAAAQAASVWVVVGDTRQAQTSGAVAVISLDLTGGASQGQGVAAVVGVSADAQGSTAQAQWVTNSRAEVAQFFAAQTGQAGQTVGGVLSSGAPNEVAIISAEARAVPAVAGDAGVVNPISYKSRAYVAVRGHGEARPL